jgi:hypothetical protein
MPSSQPPPLDPSSCLFGEEAHLQCDGGVTWTCTIGCHHFSRVSPARVITKVRPLHHHRGDSTDTTNFLAHRGQKWCARLVGAHMCADKAALVPTCYDLPPTHEMGQHPVT